MIVLENVKKIYHPGAANALEVFKDLSLHIRRGEMTAIMGRSGSGKSTLLHILACIESFQQGSYLLEGIPVNQLSDKKLARIRNEKIGMVMQNFALVEDFSALDNVLLPLDFAKRKRKDRKDLAFYTLERVGMADFAYQKVSTMSGGQKQRVAVARAIVNEPSILLADEPTGALDTASAAHIMRLFQELNQQGQTILMVTHDRQAADCCKKILTLQEGRLLG